MRLRQYGHVKGFPIGSIFPDRKTLSASGIHRPEMAGIWGGKDGAESIVVSGGYEDDIDDWDEIVYTGHGGNDPRTKRQIDHQVLSHGNLGLVANCNSGTPVRVIRGARGHSEYAPPSGYRYDGLYRVERYWPDAGKSGFRIYRFRLLRIERESSERPSQEVYGSRSAADRSFAKISRLIRDPAVSSRVKLWHRNRCQVCNIQIGTPAGPYSEAAHIIPLGKPFNGPDNTSNLLCLCPNHHKQLDRWGYSIGENFQLIGIPGVLRTHSSHQISRESLNYHFKHYTLEQA